MIVFGVFISLLIVMLIFRYVYDKNRLNALDVHISISEDTATEGDTLILTEVLTNSSWLPRPWVSVKFRADKELRFGDDTTSVSDAYYRYDLFHILMHQKITRRLAFKCSKRGYYAISGLEITGWDVLMERKYIRHYPCNVRLTVYPGLIDVREMDEVCTQVYGYLQSKFPIHQDPFSFRGIREYAPGDSMKAINAKASAKVQELMVNVWDYSNARQVMLVLDVERYAIWHNENIEERAIKIISSIAEKMCRENAPVGFMTNATSLFDATEIPLGRGTYHLREILTALAYVNTSAPIRESFSRTLEKISLYGSHEPEYWIITNYYSKATEDAFYNLKNSGIRAVWIMPSPAPTGTGFTLPDDIFFI